MGIAILRRDELNEVGKLLIVVEKRIEIRRSSAVSANSSAGIVLDVAVELNDKVSARSSKVAIATLLPNTSWIQRSDIGSGTISSCPKARAGRDRRADAA